MTASMNPADYATVVEAAERLADLKVKRRVVIVLDMEKIQDAEALDGRAATAQALGRFLIDGAREHP